MAYIEWDDSIETGIASIDREHEQLVDLINDLHCCMKNRSACMEIERILDRLVEYAFEHFRHEEELLTKHKFPGLDQHRLEHQEFIAQVDSMTKKVSPLLPMQVQRFLERWFRTHVAGTDMEYAEFLKSRGVN